MPVLNYDGRYAHATPDMPQPVLRAVEAGNRLQGKPYLWGGGHRYLYDRGYDCSGSVSFVLHHAGLLPGPRLSQDLQYYGDPGPGRFITIYARGGHVFMSICGLRLDTSDFGSGRGDGPRWRPTARSYQGYSMRHPPGL
ncbi:MAG: peptidoglycan endopeptidase [Verrucomicrobia bacterium]|nr:peptidoglycan endopeptidase [Verrucomicrobiota bacterium]